jgi:hypothetical protein
VRRDGGDNKFRGAFAIGMAIIVITSVEEGLRFG